MREIVLEDGYITYVDDADYKYLSQFAWKSKRSDGTKANLHAVREVRIGQHRLTIRMHRVIAEPRSDQRIIHIDGNTLNNTRRNLQLRTLRPWTGRSQNSGYRGVHQVSTNRWKAEIDFAGNTHLLTDSATDARSAAILYNEAAKKLYGSAAHLNDV